MIRYRCPYEETHKDGTVEKCETECRNARRLVSHYRNEHTTNGARLSRADVIEILRRTYPQIVEEL